MICTDVLRHVEANYILVTNHNGLAIYEADLPYVCHGLPYTRCCPYCSSPPVEYSISINGSRWMYHINQCGTYCATTDVIVGLSSPTITCTGIMDTEPDDII